MRPALTRHEFLRSVTAGAVAAPALAAGGAEAFSLLRVPEGLPAERSVPTYCEICFWNCGLLAEVRKGRILELRGHPECPSSRGKLCGRGHAGAALVRDGDRLKEPQLRVGRRGEGRFRRAGWNEAYATIAEAFTRIKEQHGPEALALFYHGSGGRLLRTMMAAFGTPNYAAPSYAQCKGARDVGYLLTFGESLPSPEPLDFESTRLVVLFGSHLGENAHNSQVQQLVAARARGARLVVLDPRLSTVAAKADLWLPVRPGSDTAVLLAWIHLFLAEQAYDRDYVAAHCVGLEALAEHVRPLTPAWAAEQAGVPEASLRAAYALLRAAAPAVLVHPGRHVSWYGEADTQRARAQAILTALLGAWWRPGGTFRPERAAVPAFPTPEFPNSRPDVDRAAGRFPFAPEVTTNGIREATRSGRPYAIKGWFVYGTNLFQALPSRRETIEAIEKLDMLAVCDILPTEITRWADVLLPEDVYLERYDDLLLGPAKVPAVGLRQPVVPSPYATRPAWRIAKELGARLGVGDFFAFESFEEYLETRLAGSGISLAELKRVGCIKRARQTPLYLEPGAAYEFRTPSKKIELFSAQLAAQGFDPLPVYRAIAPSAPGALRLLYGRSPLHSFGRTQNNPLLFDLEPENDLWIHPRAAAALGLRDGQRVLVRNERGDETGPLPLKVTERMPEDAVYMVHGFGHRTPGLSRTNGRGADDAALIDQYAVDPISGSTGMRTTSVTVHPAADAAGREG